jgi:hypothetical protein
MLAPVREFTTLRTGSTATAESERARQRHHILPCTETHAMHVDIWFETLTRMRFRHVSTFYFLAWRCEQEMRACD